MNLDQDSQCMGWSRLGAQKEGNLVVLLHCRWNLLPIDTMTHVCPAMSIDLLNDPSTG